MKCFCKKIYKILSQTIATSITCSCITYIFQLNWFWNEPDCALYYIRYMTIDFRSDTVTRPSPSMTDAIKNAQVGDDVFGEDPSINNLEAFAADMFGMESGLFCPSGTMSNQIAIKCHTQPAEEVICERQSHIYQYEGGGIAFNSGCQVKLIEGNRGRISAEQVAAAINPDDIHKAKSRLVSLENTANRGGGSCYEMNEILNIREVCEENGLSLHLDGARLFNAMVAKMQKPRDFGNLFDSISICLSKSLGAPVGSILLGKNDFIKKARRFRKIMGGGMRQSGIVGAAGLYALQHNIDRLAIDHEHARQIAGALSTKSFVENIYPVETNIIIFNVSASYSAKKLVEDFRKYNILTVAISGNQVRMVTHLDITADMVKTTCGVIDKL